MESHTSYRSVHRRFWRKRPEAAPLWPWGGLLLAGLVLLLLWGLLRTASWIEAEVKRETADRLASFGITDADISTDGQLVAIDIGQRSNEQAEQIRALAESTRCDSWVGSVICPRRVSLQRSGSTTEPVATGLDAQTYAHAFDFKADSGQIRLSGEIDSQGSRRQAVARAEALFEEVEDNLTVTDQAPAGPLADAVERSLATLAQLERGSAHWIDGNLHIDGLVRAEDEDSLRSGFSEAEARRPLGSLVLEITQSTSECNDAFAAQLRESTINFDTGSARIDPSSQALLSDLAALANRCPGDLRIEGHTDNVGDDNANQQLSEARADAVADALNVAGVSERRLRAIGFGEASPIADNATASGRAANRRIVIQIDSASD